MTASKPLRESRAQERRLAKTVGGRVTPRSGAGWKVKGDVRTDDALLEAKWTGKTQLTIKAAVLEKAVNEAAAELRRPVVVFTVGGLDYCVLPLFNYVELTSTPDDDTQDLRAPAPEVSAKGRQNGYAGGSA